MNSPRYTSITLGECPHEWIEIACAKCPRQGRYRKTTLLAKFGPAITMPDLRHEIAQCPRRRDFSDYCGVYYLNPVER